MVRKLLFIIGLFSVACLGQISVAQSNSTVRKDLTTEDQKRVDLVTRPVTNFDKAEPFENRPAGSATALVAPDHNAFSKPLENLTFAQREQFFIGNALFRKLWVSSPSSTLASDGLGPLFNARACQACHLKDGRGHFSRNNDNNSNLLLRLAKPSTKNGGEGKTTWELDPIYGQQLQSAAVPGLKSEVQLSTDFIHEAIEFADGSTVLLSRRVFDLTELAYGPLHEDTKVSPRIAPQMIGLGLLQAISEADLTAIADPLDSNKDGISGRLAKLNTESGTVLGRFGHKATSATILEQTAKAFSGDMGLSNSLHPDHNGDCTEVQTQCNDLPNGEQLHLGQGEVPDELLDLVVFYSSNLAPPARRNVDDKQVLQGKSLFYESGCIACHTPKFVTSRDAINPQHQFQLIWPYSDLLLHDLGDDLADEVGENNGASGREWRTAPLWGIGLTKTINPKAGYLHDGRARTLLEAVLWHGGEASKSREQVIEMNAEERSALIAFLESL